MFLLMKVRTFDGTRLKGARNAQGLSQSELARRIDAHVTSISDWERGANAPSGRHVASLSRELDVPVGHFYGDDEEEDRLPRQSLSGDLQKLAVLAGILERNPDLVDDLIAKEATGS